MKPGRLNAPTEPTHFLLGILTYPEPNLSRADVNLCAGSWGGSIDGSIAQHRITSVGFQTASRLLTSSHQISQVEFR